MVDYARPTSDFSSLYGVTQVSEDDSVYPLSSLSYRSDCDLTSSDVISLYEPASSALSNSYDETMQGCLTRPRCTGTDNKGNCSCNSSSTPSIKITRPFHRNIQIPSTEDGESVDYDNQTSLIDDSSNQKLRSFQTAFLEINDARYSLSNSFPKEDENVPQTNINSEPIVCSSSCEELKIASPKLIDKQVNGNDKQRSMSAKKFFCCSTQPFDKIQAPSDIIGMSGRTDVSLPTPGHRDAQSLYRSSITNFNPSGCGERTHQEFMELTNWANKCLSHGIVKVQINDLASDLGDGLTLLDLVEVLTGESPPQLHIKPALLVQKIENIQACLEFLEQKGVSTEGITSEDVVKGNMKVVLALCHCLKRAFGSPTGAPNQFKGETFYEVMPLNNSQNKDHNMNQSVNIQETLFTPVMAHTHAREAAQLCSVDHCNIDELHSETKTRDYSGSPVDLEKDNALLHWVAVVTGQTVRDYSDFQSGDLLCNLVNTVTNGAVPERVMKSGSPFEKVNIALQVCREELGINCGLQAVDVVPSCDPFKLLLFLKRLRKLLTQHLEAEKFQNIGSITKTESNWQLNKSGDKIRGLIESKQSGVVSCSSERRLKKEQELKAKIDFYEKEKLKLEETLGQFQSDRSANDTSIVDFNGNYIGLLGARAKSWGSPCEYLNETAGKMAKSYEHYKTVESDGALRVSGEIKIEALSSEGHKRKSSKTYFRETEPPVFLFQRPNVSRHYDLLEETSVFEPCNKWKTPSSQELKTCQFKTEKHHEITSARQRLWEIKRNLELLKLMYLSHSENDNDTRVESRETPRLSKATRNRDKNSLVFQGLSQSRSPVDIAPNTGPSYSRLTANDMIFDSKTRFPYNPNTTTIEYDDTVNMKYPPVNSKVPRPRSADVLSHRRPHSAEPRPKSAGFVVSDFPTSTYYRNSPDVLNRINTHRNYPDGFSVSGYIDASESQLFLPRSRPLGINDPVSVRTKKKIPLQSSCISTPKAGSLIEGCKPVPSTRKRFSEPAEDAELHLGDSFVVSESIAAENGDTNSQGSRPDSRTSTDEAKTSADAASDNESGVSRLPKPHTLTALIRMTAKKASG